jgi:hypothetical protein
MKFSANKAKIRRLHLHICYHKCFDINILTFRFIYIEVYDIRYAVFADLTPCRKKERFIFSIKSLFYFEQSSCCSKRRKVWIKSPIKRANYVLNWLSNNDFSFPPIQFSNIGTICSWILLWYRLWSIPEKISLEKVISL